MSGTPRDIVLRLNAEVSRILGQSDEKERLEREGAELVAGSPERLSAIIAADLARWKKLISTRSCVLINLPSDDVCQTARARIDCRS